MKLKISGKANTYSLKVNSDKSIGHRALLFCLLCEGRETYKVFDLTISKDIEASIEAIKSLGAEVTIIDRDVLVKAPKNIIDCHINCKNSGTTMRLLCGILAGRNCQVKLTGDESLSARPMGRVVSPLKLMGAKIDMDAGDRCPLHIRPCGKLTAIDFELPIASAQIKSAVILSSFSMEQSESLELSGLLNSRDHTERLLHHWNVEIFKSAQSIKLKGAQKVTPTDLVIPGDISSAAFWLTLGVLTKRKIVIENIGLNPTRMGFCLALKKMGLPIIWKVEVNVFEPQGTISLNNDWTDINPIEITQDEVASLIDEIPLLAIMMGLANGISTINGIGELKYKESDRLENTEELLRGLKISFKQFDKSLEINGSSALELSDISSLYSSMDHRIIMILGVLEEAFACQFGIENRAMVETSYPNFWKELKNFNES